MALTKLSLCVLIMIVLEPYDYSVEGEKACSCYTFEDGDQPMTWQNAKTSCEFYNKSLVVMETLKEWEFINGTIKTRTAKPYSEWHIGLFKNRTNGDWRWINGKPLTFDKWRSGEPRTNDHYVVIVKQWPPGFYGLFNGINGMIQRGWICEHQTDECKGICMQHYKTSTTTMAPPKTITTALRESTTLLSTTEKLSHTQDYTTSPNATAMSSVTDSTNLADKGKPSHIPWMIAALLGWTVVIFLFLWLCLRKAPRKEGRARNQPRRLSPSKHKSGDVQEDVTFMNLTEIRSQISEPESGYAALNMHKMMCSNGATYTSLVPSGQENNPQELSHLQEDARKDALTEEYENVSGICLNMMSQ